MRLATFVQPGARGLDGFLLIAGHGVPADVCLLDRILGFGERAQEPVGEIDQLAPLAHDRAQARVGPAVSWLGLRGHGAPGSLGSPALTSSTRLGTEL
jgi:hypothetical protein